MCEVKSKYLQEFLFLSLHLFNWGLAVPEMSTTNDLQGNSKSSFGVVDLYNTLETAKSIVPLVPNEAFLVNSLIENKGY